MFLRLEKLQCHVDFRIRGIFRVFQVGGHCPPTACQKVGGQWGGQWHPKILSGGALFKKVQKWGGTRSSAPPLPGLKYTPARGGTFDLESLAIQKKCPPTKKSRGKPWLVVFDPSTRLLLSLIHIIGTFDGNNSSTKYLKYIATSQASAMARVSAESVLLTTLFIFTDLQIIGHTLSPSVSNITYPP